MKTLKGPGLFLAQFAGDAAPFNSLDSIAGWAAGLGYKAIQLPCDRRLFDLDRPPTARPTATKCRHAGRPRLQVSELSTHLQGQLVAVHPAYDTLFDGFAAPQVRGNPAARRPGPPTSCCWPRAPRAPGPVRHVSFSGALAWPYIYPVAAAPAGLVEDGLRGTGAALAADPRRLRRDAGVDLCYELHPGEDLFDGATFERFLERRGRPPRAPTSLRPQPLPAAAARLPGLHRHLPRAHQGLPRQGCRVPPDGGRACMAATSSWQDRAGRFRSLGDGQIDFKAIFSKMAQYDFRAGPCWNGSAA
jgi:sugar phosphate isomerase/epimerase